MCYRADFLASGDLAQWVVTVGILFPARAREKSLLASR